MERELNAAIADVDVVGAVGRTSSFEVVVDDSLVAWSKLTSGSFPDYKAVAAAVAEYAKSGTAPSSWTKK